MINKNQDFLGNLWKTWPNFWRLVFFLFTCKHISPKVFCKSWFVLVILEIIYDFCLLSVKYIQVVTECIIFVALDNYFAITNFFLTKFHFLQFQKWLKNNFWTGKKFKTAKNAISRKKMDLFDFTSFFAWTFLNFLSHCGAVVVHVQISTSNSSGAPQ